MNVWKELVPNRPVKPLNVLTVDGPPLGTTPLMRAWRSDISSARSERVDVVGLDPQRLRVKLVRALSRREILRERRA